MCTCVCSSCRRHGGLAASARPENTACGCSRGLMAARLPLTAGILVGRVNIIATKHVPDSGQNVEDVVDVVLHGGDIH